MADPSPPIAVVLLSGGVDSATTLAIAAHEGFDCRCLTFDYGQRHRFELAAARAVARAMKVTDHRVVKVDLRACGGSALTDDIDVPKDQPPPREGIPGDIPVTYVPARNTVFLSLALGRAEVLGSTDIFIGVNAIDYSGYPDCRPQYIEAFETMASLATKMGVQGTRIRIHTPLIKLTKAQIIRRGVELGVDYGLTFSCYDPDEGGHPCGRCDACLLRQRGFEEAGLPDPARPA
ncbi:MAG: 7-cyano-7-deazaguanine synthase QueC [Planctomycetota bacterium]|jgi:7-cyano-7-deazaguanine synthase